LEVGAGELKLLEYLIAQRRVMTANGPMNRDPRFSEMSLKAKEFQRERRKKFRLWHLCQECNLPHAVPGLRRESQVGDHREGA
jgi:hypothetical protein